MRIKLYITGALYNSPCATGEIYLQYSYNDTPSPVDIVIVVFVRVAPEQKIIRRHTTELLCLIFPENTGSKEAKYTNKNFNITKSSDYKSRC